MKKRKETVWEQLRKIKSEQGKRMRREYAALFKLILIYNFIN